MLHSRRTALGVLFLALVCADPPTAQQTIPLPSGETFRVTRELVQTDVVVFDKQGRFVDNIPPCNE